MLSIENVVLAAWSASLALTFFMVEQFNGGTIEYIGATLMFLVVLLLLDRRWSPAVLVVTGYCACCVIVGCMTIDGAFDSIVMAGEDVTLKLGSSMFGTALSARQVAWIYYHTMLNTLMVNGTVTFCVGYCALAGLALGLRSEPRHSKYWRKIVLLNVISTAAYTCVIVPKYYLLRSEEVFDSAFFDGWEAVVVARIVSLSCMFIGMSIAFPVLCDLAAKR